MSVLAHAFFVLLFFASSVSWAMPNPGAVADYLCRQTQPRPTLDYEKNFANGQYPIAHSMLKEGACIHVDVLPRETTQNSPDHSPTLSLEYQLKRVWVQHDGIDERVDTIGVGAGRKPITATQ